MAPLIQSLWLALDDALHVQRVALHLGEWQEVVSSRRPVPGAPQVEDAAALAGQPPAGPAGSDAIVRAAGVGTWLALPARHGVPGAPENPLAEAATRAVTPIVAGADGVWAQAARATAGAAPWWVGFFAAIRHRGVHHTSLTPVRGEVGLDVLQQATGVMALGLALRVIEAGIRLEAGDGTVRDAYCRGLVASIELERSLPRLLDELGELRLVDLVTTSVPWRGRFIKYAGGTGAGQVEA